MSQLRLLTMGSVTLTQFSYAKNYFIKKSLEFGFIIFS